MKKRLCILLAVVCGAAFVLAGCTSRAIQSGRMAVKACQDFAEHRISADELVEKLNVIGSTLDEGGEAGAIGEKLNAIISAVTEGGDFDGAYQRLMDTAYEEVFGES